MGMRQRINDILGRAGYEIHRAPAAHRQQMMGAHDVDIVLDIGAATGQYGLQLRRFGYKGAIVSFEPLATSFARLERAVESDRSWTAVQCALGSEPGTARINIASNYDSSSLLPMLETHRLAAPSIGEIGTEEIRVERLDDVAREYLQGAKAPYLKLDTQGFERQVLDGGPETVRQAVGLQIELSFVPLYGGGMLADEAIQWAYDEGFVMVGFELGFISPTGQLMSGDGVFFRE